ncbi:MAG: 16S rRNA (uracil(1498)-N(3))-methyltransferase, partial [Firmicutes bacterium]|nr:16S rRNA (uracil(1498)-N(3))-methyltransferase [Bacillota bacterium]
MPHFFVAPEAVADGRVLITGPDARHIARVLRMGPGDCLTVSDGRFLYRAEITAVRSREVEAVVHERWESDVEPRYRVRLVQGVPKGDKMDSVVRQATEVGVAEIVPLLSRYVVPERTPDAWGRRVERWRRIAREAAKTSGRAAVPPVRDPAGWEQVLALLGPG